MTESIDLATENIDLATESIDLVTESIDLVTESVDLVTESVDLMTESVDLTTESVDLLIHLPDFTARHQRQIFAVALRALEIFLGREVRDRLSKLLFRCELRDCLAEILFRRVGLEILLGREEWQELRNLAGPVIEVFDLFFHLRRCPAVACSAGYGVASICQNPSMIQGFGGMPILPSSMEVARSRP